MIEKEHSSRLGANIIETLAEMELSLLRSIHTKLDVVAWKSLLQIQGHYFIIAENGEIWFNKLWTGGELQK